MRIRRHDAAGIVELSDGSRWRIWPGDIATTLGWLPTTQLEIAPSNDELWSHVLVNVTDNTKVRVIAANEDWPAGATRQVLRDDQT
jgi:hypothetical protein